MQKPKKESKSIKKPKKKAFVYLNKFKFLQEIKLLQAKEKKEPKRFVQKRHSRPQRR